MKSSHTKKNKLQSIMNKSFIDDSAGSSYKNKQLQELERLKNICFPKREKENISEHSTLTSTNQSSKKERSNSNVQSRGRDLSYERKEKSNSFIEKTRTSSAGHREHSSLIIGRERSFNMSPLRKATLSDEEFELESSFEKAKNKDYTPVKVINTANICNTFGKPQEKVIFNLEDMLNLKDCKSPRHRENFLAIVDGLTGEMNRFVVGLLDGLKGTCITRMSEKSVNLMVKKYISKIDELKEHWHEQMSSNHESFYLNQIDDDFNSNLKNLIQTLGAWYILSIAI